MCPASASRLQGAGGRGDGPCREGARASACSSTARSTRGPVPRGGPSLLDRPPRRGAGVLPARFRRCGSLAAKLLEWPVGHTIKALCFYRPDDPPRCASVRSGSCCGCTTPRAASGASLVEIIASKHGAMALTPSQGAGAPLRPRHQARTGGSSSPRPTPPRGATAEVIGRRDPLCRGIVLLGLEAPEAESRGRLLGRRARTSRQRLRGGRTLFNEAARQWLKGEMTDEAAIAGMASRFQRLVEAWQRAAGLAKAA